MFNQVVVMIPDEEQEEKKTLLPCGQTNPQMSLYEATANFCDEDQMTKCLLRTHKNHYFNPHEEDAV